MATTVTRHRLRRRFVTVLLGLTLISALMLTLGFWASESYVETASLNSLLAREMRYRLDAKQPSSTQTEGGDAPLYFNPGVDGIAPPAALTKLPLGVAEGVALGTERYVVLVAETSTGGHAWLAYNDTARQRRETLLFAALAAGIVLIGIAGYAVARRLARQAVAPLDSLVIQLQALDPEQRQQRLPPPPSDSELAVIVEALNGYMTRLDELVERERAFAAAASHELRTPLAIIRGAAEVLEASPNVPKPVGRIHRAVLAAQRDLDALLWLSRPDQPAAAETLALHECLIALCDSQIDPAAVQWSLAACTVTAPPGAVTVIVSNLLRNALRAAPQACGVRVTLTAQALIVDDDGDGIPPEELPHVFDPRTRGRDGGTGMGLYIASTLSKRLGWTLTLEYRPEGGARARLGF